MTLEERLKVALAADAPAELHASDLDDADAGPLRDAAVLVAVTDRPEPGILFTVRHAELRTHAGQISFPGGQVDPGDRDAADTATREAAEEIGLDPSQIRLCGTADPYRTITRYRIIPVVGVIPPDLHLHADPREVSDVFEAPLAFVLDPANHRRADVEYQGKKRFYTEIDWQGRRIWGATAAMLVNLSRRLR